MNEVLNDSQLEMAVAGDESQPEEVAQVVQPPAPGSNVGKKKKKKFTNENNSSSDEGSNGQFPFESQQDTDNMGSFIPANAGLYNNRRVMTAPDGKGRRRGGKSIQNAPPVLSGAFHQTFVESDLMKAANIYQQFDKKGNLYENRLYAKTSINQAKFNQDQTIYDKKMQNHPDEMCRINNGSTFQDGIDPEKSFAVNQLNKSQKDGSINITQNGSVSINDQIRNSSQQSMTRGFKNGVRTSTGMQFGRLPQSAQSPRTQEMRFTQLSGGTVTGGTFTKAFGPKISKKGPMSQSSLFSQIEAQNTLNNKDQKLSSQAKSLSNMQFTNVQKSFNRLQSLNAYNSSWSRRDYDPKYLTNGIGGAQNTFSGAVNLKTNDPALFKEKGFNQTSQEFRPRETSEMLNTFYHYYGAEDNGKTIKVLDLPDKKGTFGVSRYINSSGKAMYSKQLDNKGRSKIAFTERDHAAGYTQAINKIQKKAYRANTQSRQVDGLYKEGKFTQRPSYINYSRQDFNILRPNLNVKQLSVSIGDPKILVESMRAGKCHQIYGISDFNQNNRSAGLKYHEKYQGAYNKDPQMFRRTNGEFTQHQNALKQCKF